ncbi:MAG: DUF6657 family protein, partial [Sphaerochaetaceae bacterium]
MSLIKSAWEIALEKTEHIQVDEQKIAKNAKRQEGRKLAADFLHNFDVTFEQTKKKLGMFKGEEKKQVIEGIVMAFLDNVSLPRNDQYKQEFAKVIQLSTLIGSKEVEQLTQQLLQFFEQYLAQQKQLTERLKQQYQPKLEQKQAQLAQQYGDDFVLKAEQDPEFIKMLDENL